MLTNFLDSDQGQIAVIPLRLKIFQCAGFLTGFGVDDVPV
jgi:hypothetical protein